MEEGATTRVMLETSAAVFKQHNMLIIKFKVGKETG